MEFHTLGLWLARPLTSRDLAAAGRGWDTYCNVGMVHVFPSHGEQLAYLTPNLAPNANGIKRGLDGSCCSNLYDPSNIKNVSSRRH